MAESHDENILCHVTAPLVMLWAHALKNQTSAKKEHIMSSSSVHNQKELWKCFKTNLKTRNELKIHEKYEKTSNWTFFTTSMAAITKFQFRAFYTAPKQTFGGNFRKFKIVYILSDGNAFKMCRMIGLYFFFFIFNRKESIHCVKPWIKLYIMVL